MPVLAVALNIRSLSTWNLQSSGGFSWGNMRSNCETGETGLVFEDVLSSHRSLLACVPTPQYVVVAERCVCPCGSVGMRGGPGGSGISIGLRAQHYCPPLQFRRPCGAMGGHDGAYKGRVHVIFPFVGRKNGKIIDRQQSYNVLVLRFPGL